MWYNSSGVMVMSSPWVSVNLPAELLTWLDPKNLEKEVRKRVAVALYAERKISLRQGAKLAGIPYADFMKALGEFGVYIDYGVEDLRQDMKTLKELGLYEGDL